MDNNTKGQLSEAKALSKLIEIGYSVYIPWDKTNKSDFIIEKDGNLFRVQCKTAKLQNDGSVLSFKTCSMHSRTKVRSSYKGIVDKFVVYSYELDKVYLIDISDLEPNTIATLRVAPSKNNQQKNARMSEDYEI